MPDQWATAYPTCGGTSQSPIDIVTANVVPKWMSPLQVSYPNALLNLQLQNNGHTAAVVAGQLPYSLSGLDLADTYNLDTFHLHWNSVARHRHPGA